MSILSDLDALILRSTNNPPLTDKGSELTYAEFDGNFVKLYDAVQSIVSGQGVTAYDAGATYDMFGTSIYEKFASYDGRIWKAVYVGSPSSFSGQTPAESIYWTQVTLAEMLPNVSGLAQFATNLQTESNPCPQYCTSWQSFTNQDLNSNPVDIIGLEARGAGTLVVPVAVLFSLDAGGTAYDFGVAGINLVYSSVAATPILQAASQSAINSASDTNRFSNHVQTSTGVIENDKIQLSASSDATQGNGTYYIRVVYKIMYTAF